MKTTDEKDKKQFRELSEEELQEVNGGGIFDRPEECKNIGVATSRCVT